MLRKIITLRCSERQYERIKEYAHQERTSMNRVVLGAVEESIGTALAKQMSVPNEVIEDEEGRAELLSPVC